MKPLSATVVAFLVLLPAAGCISERLDVTIRTLVHADGSCTRQIEYRLERTSTDAKELAKEPGYRSAPEKDPLRVRFRLPSGEPWRVQDEVQSEELHKVAAEATFPSANDIDWDYWNMRAPGGPPTRNHFSFWTETSGEETSYAYAEAFRPPVSPLAAARKVASLLLERSADGVDVFARALDDGRLDRAALRRVVRDGLTKFQRRVEALAARPLFGPRERQELNVLVEEAGKELEAAVGALLAGIDEERVKRAAEATSDSLGPSFQKEMDDLGISLPGDGSMNVHFQVVLVMPAAIVRANTCFSGDTASWEFDQGDLDAGGFEMWAKAATK